MFDYTSRERGMWRAWTKSGQSLEISWGWRRASVGLRVGQHGRSRHVWIGVGIAQAFIPIGIDPKGDQYGRFDEPDYGLDISVEHGVWWRWGLKSKRWEWPFRVVTLAWDYETETGWATKLGRYVPHAEREPAKTETHPYTYVLRSGEIQKREATITRERWVLGRRILHRLGWPKRRKMEIDVRFSDEVGERSGSWKGGCVGCSYEMKPGETPLETLRRMERERKF